MIDSKQKDNVKSLHSSLSTVLKKLTCSGSITKQFSSFLLSSGHNTPRLYGLPKTHKADCPLRPILSMSGSPTHRTARWLSELLQPVRDFYSKYCIKDTFEFVNSVRDYNLKDFKMMSLDIASLFTNVPVYETIDVIVSTITDNNIDLGIDVNVLRELLVLCTTDVQFLFGGQLYRQIDGVAMGSCLGPIFADIFVGSLESKISNVIADSSVAFTRYVDDCFVILKSTDKLSSLMDAVNGVHPAISYSYEVETNNTLNFLDVTCVRRPDGSVKTSVYRKPTWTGLYSNFQSFVPRRYKLNLVKSLVSRAVKICCVDSLDSIPV